ncbi:helix-turn-helix transcriptional regulator [Proteiniborus sp. MB09-C3]|uniref:helix-turn-helix domain-containing protein n=1 Tax=Proteiniborus sp. MB09-C3 TaxID=3050072 RepID=UPI0025548BC6|nr:helix-turn-helix transcriptional regulator [Proteiniborus sp. MB09-C3]WIV13262.1 helix-turn-helix transcriptional regulator [Proteiniborus sp. MB09-C3]
MRNENEVSAGENLKRIRKELGLRQHEIAGEDITRNLISLIENNRAVLYDTAANIMAKNMNKIMYERDISIFIKPEDLLNPERYDARKKADTYIEELENILIKKEFYIESEKLNEIEAFLNQWDLVDKKVKIYELLGDIFYISNNLNKEYYYYFKALEASYDYPNMKERYKLALKLVYNCIITGKNEEAINLCDYMLLSQKSIPNKYKGAFYYNKALGYKYLLEIDKCLIALDNAKKYFKDSSNKDLKKVLMLEGVCHFRTGKHTRALKSYNEILKISEEKNDIDEICVAYINIIQIYIAKNDKEKVIKCFDKVMMNLPYVNEDSFYLPEIYYETSNIYLYLENYEASEKHLNAALALSKKSGKHNLYKKFISSLVELYIQANWIDKLHNLMSILENEFSNIKLNEEITLVLKLLLYYMKQNNHKAAEDIIINLLKKEKEV